VASPRLTVRHHDPNFVNGVQTALDSLRTLAPNGDGYGAPAIDFAVIEAAKSFVAKLPENLLEEAEEGGYVVTSPLNPELITQAETIEEAFANARDAAKALRQSRATLMRR